MNAVVSAIKKYIRVSLPFLFIFLAGFIITSGLFSRIFDKAEKLFVLKVGSFIPYHCTTLEREARHYFLLPHGRYTIDLFDKPLSDRLAMTVAINALFNSLFQPIFFCIFTPQALLNFALFPFFLYGVIKYFRNIPIVILIFFIVYIYAGLYGSVIEALIRHRISCELIYLLIGVAGLTGLTIKNSS